jgi:serine/threonine protein kinase
MAGERVLAERYTVIKELGHGGMGSTLLAKDNWLERQVVIKLPLHASMEGIFLKEARALAAVNHVNAVKLFDIGHDGQQPFLVMELIHGWDLHKLIANVGPLPPAQAVRIFSAVCQAVAQSHAVGVIHRDIKPHNILIGSDDVPRLADFGLAKLNDMKVTNPGVGMGTPHYVAPEQMQDASKVDHRADIFSLGVTLLLMLTGDPFPKDRSVIPKAPSEFHNVIDRCMDVHPKHRIQTVEALLEALPSHRQFVDRRPELQEMFGTEKAFKALKDYGAVPTRKRDHIELVFNLGQVRLSGKGKKRTSWGTASYPLTMPRHTSSRCTTRTPTTSSVQTRRWPSTAPQSTSMKTRLRT